MNESKDAGNLSARIWGTALIVGGIAFAAGFFGGLILYPESNLSPLLGIFITGPMGFVAGALIGVARAAQDGRADTTRPEFVWLAAMWVVSLLYMIAFAGGGWGWVSLALQAATVATAAYVFYGTGVRPVPQSVEPFRGPILGAGMLSLFASIFPPVIAKGDDQQRFAWFLDPRFDARYEVPEFSVDGSGLALEWLILALLALAIGFAIRALSTQPDS